MFRTLLPCAMLYRYSYCSEERNPHVDALLAHARANHHSEEAVLKTRRNCEITSHQKCGTNSS